MPKKSGKTNGLSTAGICHKISKDNRKEKKTLKIKVSFSARNYISGKPLVRGALVERREARPRSSPLEGGRLRGRVSYRKT